MKRLTLFTLVFLLFALSGCGSMLEGEDIYITPHVEPSAAQQDEETQTAADYQELYDAVYDIILRRADTGSINVFDYIGDWEIDAQTIIADITGNDAFGAYVLEDITITAAQIVSYVRLDVSVLYRKTRTQMSAIVTVENTDELPEKLLRILTDYRSEAAFISSLPEITPAYITDKITELYYENPLKIVMLPVMETTVYPDFPVGKRLIEIQFGYSQRDTVLRAFGTLLDTAVRDIAERVDEGDSVSTARLLCTLLGEIAVYDAASASVPEYSTLNFSATAYGALLGGSANSEGYAMAYKALCDVLEFECVVVAGTKDGRRSAWNILTIDDISYHIDPAMCDEYGFDSYFMMDDSEMEIQGYRWDRDKYPVCGSEN